MPVCRRSAARLAAAVLFAALVRPSVCAEGAATIRGKLVQRPGAPPALQLPDGKQTPLGGDKDTLGVLNDKRLAGAELELKGRAAAGVFTVDPIHTKAMHVHRGGKRLVITYWCDVCAIRTYTPGICWCCQEETQLDLREGQ